MDWTRVAHPGLTPRRRVDRGATTLRERRDGIETHGTFEDPGMSSFDDHSFGSVSARAGRRLHPRPRHAALAQGAMIVSDWTIDNGTFTLEVTIPAGTRAAVKMPTAAAVTSTACPPERPAPMARTSRDRAITCSSALRPEDDRPRWAGDDV